MKFETNYLSKPLEQFSYRATEKHLIGDNPKKGNRPADFYNQLTGCKAENYAAVHDLEVRDTYDRITFGTDVDYKNWKIDVKGQWYNKEFDFQNYDKIHPTLHGCWLNIANHQIYDKKFDDNQAFLFYLLTYGKITRIGWIEANEYQRKLMDPTDETCLEETKAKANGLKMITGTNIHWSQLKPIEELDSTYTDDRVGQTFVTI